MAGSSTADAPAFFFDLASPAAYVAAERALESHPGVEWVPVLARELPGAESWEAFRCAEERNIAKARLLYDYIDSSDFYLNPVDKADRSRMNVPFRLANPELEADFLAGAATNNMVELKGHRSVGGVRASLYNAMPIEGVQALVDYMAEFEAQKG